MAFEQFKTGPSRITPSSTSLNKLLNEAARSEMFTDSDVEIETIKKAQGGDFKALEKIVKANLRFIISVAKQYQGRGFELNDLINEGAIGLMRSVNGFDPTRGFKFITYARDWIQASITEAINNKGSMVKPPRLAFAYSRKIKSFFDTFEQREHREPNDAECEELAKTISLEHEGLSLAKAKNAIAMWRLGFRHFSLDAPLGDDEDTFADFQPGQIDSPDHGLSHHESLKKEIARSLNILNPKERQVIEMYFGIGSEFNSTPEDIALKLGVVPERVRQLKASALKKIHEHSASELRGFLG